MPVKRTRQRRRELGEVVLTQNFKEAVKGRILRNPAFAKAMLDEAATAFLNGESHVARLILHDLVNASVGFENLVTETMRPAKSRHRMLSEQGNPSMNALAAIIGAIRKRLGVAFEVQTVDVTGQQAARMRNRQFAQLDATQPCANP